MMGTHIHDLPDVILLNILAAVSHTRSRNAAALVSRKWLLLERATRPSLSLRGNAPRDLHLLPTSFRAVSSLDLSLLSPWGGSHSPRLLSHAFPRAADLTLYARTPHALHLIAPRFPSLSSLKLVRWHKRDPSAPQGADFDPVFEHCKELANLDLSEFYHWTEDLPAALSACPEAGSRLGRLDLMTRSLQEGFRTSEIRVVTEHCPNLVEFRAVCVFDPRRIDFVGDQGLEAIGSNCGKLKVLHLANASALADPRGGMEEGDAGFGTAALVELFRRLGSLEDLCLDVCRNVAVSGVALEVLKSACPSLRALKLGQFQTICLAVESQLDGVALCGGLRSFSIKNCDDLNDMGLIAIARGCSMLAKFEVVGCKEITMWGIRTMASLLRRTLVEVKISRCKNMNAALSLQAVEPIRDRIQRLHIDCVWTCSEGQGLPGEEDFQNIDLDEFEEEDEDGSCAQSSECIDFFGREQKKKRKCEEGSLFALSNGSSRFWFKTWDQLQYLSLWAGVGELLPLAMAGLEDCPKLEEILIKVEGDCRDRPRPSENAFGLSCLAQYPRLRKMQLDCGGAEGNALTAPAGQMDVSLWERFYLNGIETLCLDELDYWVPQDRDLNQRSLSLPAAGLLAQCTTLRKLFIHGTANEHFLNFLLRIPNLRDVQLRADYYPAPEDDMSTEMRVDSCSRFEDSLNMRRILD